MHEVQFEEIQGSYSQKVIPKINNGPFYYVSPSLDKYIAAQNFYDFTFKSDGSAQFNLISSIVHAPLAVYLNILLQARICHPHPLGIPVLANYRLLSLPEHFFPSDVEVHSVEISAHEEHPGQVLLDAERMPDVDNFLLDVVGAIF